MLLNYCCTTRQKQNVLMQILVRCNKFCNFYNK